MNEVEVPESLRYLVEWYSEYAKQIVIDRAIVNIDGFKPSHRRIFYAMKYFEKVKDLVPSTAAISATYKLHPHGDVIIYETMARLVSSTRRQGTPFLDGKGSFGRVHSSKSPAAPRYTKVSFNPLSEELFRDMAGVKMVASEDGAYMEPEVLPVSFPNILTNPVAGIAVGLASNIPSFNFHEVLQATIDLIERGDTDMLLAPDFPSAGVYVEDKKELQKIMTTGRGRLKIRGKWHIEGKVIIIDEIPYYTTQESIKSQLETALNSELITGVTDVRIESDFDGLRIAVECNNKNSVDQVLTGLLRYTSLQTSIMTNLTVIIDKKPRVLGVKDLLLEWIKFRTEVLSKQWAVDLESLSVLLERYSVYGELLGDEEKRVAFTSALGTSGPSQARSLLVEWFPSASKDTIDWVLDKKLSQFAWTKDFSDRLSDYRSQQKQLLEDLSDVPRAIARQLKSLSNRYSFPRQTEISELDYNFEDLDNIVVKAEPEPVFVFIDNKFIKKVRQTRLVEGDGAISCMSDDVISFIDNKGRLLRVNLEHLDFVSSQDRGVYLPVALGLPDDFEVVAHEVVADKKVGYVYSDGFVSVVDYGEWFNGSRVTRVTNNGVSPLASLIVGEVDLDKPYLLLFTRAGRFGFVSNDFKHKHRTARTKLMEVTKNDEIVSSLSLTYPELLQVVTQPESYLGKLSYLRPDDTFNSDFVASLI